VERANNAVIDRPTNIFGTEGNATDYFAFKEYRKYQKKIIDKIERAFEYGYRYVILDAPVGSGKSVIGYSFARQSGAAHILTIQKLLQDQYKRDFKDAFVMKGRGSYRCVRSGGVFSCADGLCKRKRIKKCIDCPYTIAREHAESSPITVHNFDSFYWTNLMGKGYVPRHLLIIDECFPKNTLVQTDKGNLPIQDIGVGDTVLAFNDITGAFAWKTVKSTTVRQTFEICEITYSDGKTLVVTPNHPFLTKRGWVNAKDLIPNADFVYSITHSVIKGELYGEERAKTKSKISLSLFGNKLQLLWEKLCKYKYRKNRVLPQNWKILLFKRMCLFSKIGCFKRENSIQKSKKTILRKNEITQPDVRSFNTREGENIFVQNKAQTNNSGRERKRTYITTKDDGDGFGLGNRRNNNNRKRAENEIHNSESLQSGYSQFQFENSYRNRRSISWFFKKAVARSKERKSIAGVGVESIAIYKQGSSERFGELCGSGYVYNLEVEDYHTYIAGNRLVHNCHNIPSKYADFLSFTVSSTPQYEIPEFDDIRDYTELLKNIRDDSIAELNMIDSLKDAMDGLDTENVRREAELRKTLVKLNRYLLNLERKDSTEYVFDYKSNGKYGGKVTFKPLYVADFVKDGLFRYGDKVLLMSATILSSNMFCREVGLDPEEVYYLKVPSTFPTENHPIWPMNSGSMSMRNIQKTLPKMLDTIKRILDKHPNDKGIIQTHSEKIANYIKSNLHSSRLLFNKDFNDPYEMLEVHKSRPNSIIVASGLREGLDLYGNLSKLQIFCKVPYPSLGDKWVKRRLELNPVWYGYITTLMFVQAIGRSIRSADDEVDTYILDSDFGYYYKRNKQFIPDYIRESIIWGRK